jgi:hypothetical protein
MRSRTPTAWAELRRLSSARCSGWERPSSTGRDLYGPAAGFLLTMDHLARHVGPPFEATNTARSSPPGGVTALGIRLASCSPRRIVQSPSARSPAARGRHTSQAPTAAAWPPAGDCDQPRPTAPRGFTVGIDARRLPQSSPIGSCRPSSTRPSRPLWHARRRRRAHRGFARAGCPEAEEGYLFFDFSPEWMSM